MREDDGGGVAGGVEVSRAGRDGAEGGARRAIGGSHGGRGRGRGADAADAADAAEEEDRAEAEEEKEEEEEAEEDDVRAKADEMADKAIEDHAENEKKRERRRSATTRPRRSARAWRAMLPPRWMRRRPVVNV